MGIMAQLTNVVHAVACRNTSPKPGCTNIDGISPMVNGSYTALQILGRCKQF